MEIIFWIMIGLFGLCGVLILGLLIYLIIFAIYSPEIDYTSTRPARPPKQRIILDEEDADLCPFDLVAKYGIELTDEEFDRFMFDPKFTQKVLNENFQTQMQHDMETAMQMHHTAHQMSMDAHQQAHDVAMQHMDLHNDMFNNSCGNPFF